MADVYFDHLAIQLEGVGLDDEAVKLALRSSDVLARAEFEELLNRFHQEALARALTTVTGRSPHRAMAALGPAGRLLEDALLEAYVTRFELSLDGLSAVALPALFPEEDTAVVVSAGEAPHARDGELIRW